MKMENIWLQLQKEFIRLMLLEMNHNMLHMQWLLLKEHRVYVAKETTVI